MQDPTGNVVWYHSMQKGFVTLDRDDRGNYLDEVTVNGVTHHIALNQETVTVRGILPGEYVVNVYHFTNPSSRRRAGDGEGRKGEPEALRRLLRHRAARPRRATRRPWSASRMDQDGAISDINTVPVSLIQAVRK